MDTYGVLTQIFQPYFYYSIVILVASFICIKLFTYFCPTVPSKIKSLLYLIPLMAPLLVMAIYIPSNIIRPGLLQVTSGTATTAPSTLQAAPITAANVTALQPAGLVTLSAANFVVATVVSVTGVLCIIGLFASAVFGVLMVLANDRIARRVLYIIPLTSEEYPWLQTRIVESSKKIGLATPKVGVVEDLRPNAFTVGYGKNATVVFSMGLLNILSQDEVAAVASHEIAHISNRDFFHNVLSSTLTLLSFFNPVSYFASTAAQREREMLADQGAVDMIEKPSVLGDALAKICRAIEAQPKEGFKASLSANLFATSSILHRVSILSTHPRLDKRLRNISKPNSNARLSRLRVGVTVLALALILVCCMLASSMFLASMQQSGYGYLQIKAYDVNSTSYGLVSNGGLVFSMSPVTVRAANFSTVASPVLVASPVALGAAAVVGNGSVLLGTGLNGSVVFSQGSLAYFP
jgi:Zn-dependent protease with chaperone function